MKHMFKYLILIIVLLCSNIYAAPSNCVALSAPSVAGSTSDTQLLYAFMLAKMQKKSCVYLPRGTWSFINPINVPDGIKLIGNNDDIHNSTDFNFKYGTSINCMHGTGLDSIHIDHACITVGNAGGVDGINMAWPNQNNDIKKEPIRYPFGIVCVGQCFITNVTMANAVNGLMLNGDNNIIKNFNAAAYKRGIVINSPGNFGSIYNGNIHDQFLWNYYQIPIASIEDPQKINPDIDYFENLYLHRNLVGIQINNSTEGVINGFFIYKALEGFKINAFANGIAGKNNNPISLVNSGCDLCNYSLRVVSQKPNNIFQFNNGQLFGKIKIDDQNQGIIQIYNTQATYAVTEFETGTIPHIAVYSPATTLYISNGDITTGGYMVDSKVIKFSSGIILTAGQVVLRNVNFITGQLYAEGYKTEIPGVKTLVDLINERYVTFAKDFRHVVTNGPYAGVTYINGYLEGYDDFRPIQYIDGHVYTDGKYITNIGVINVKPRGQWTSNKIEKFCEDKMGAFEFLCPEALNDPDWRYKPKTEQESF